MCRTKVACDEPSDDEEDGIERAVSSDSDFALSSEEEEDEEVTVTVRTPSVSYYDLTCIIP